MVGEAYNVVLLKFLDAGLPRSTVPDEGLKKVVRMQFNLVPPLHDSNGRPKGSRSDQGVPLNMIDTHTQQRD